MTWYQRLLSSIAQPRPALLPPPTAAPPTATATVTVTATATASATDKSPTPAPEPRPQIRTDVNPDSVYNPLTGLGGTGDKGAVGRPNPYVEPLNLDELRLLYGYNGISRRIIDIIPQRACRRGWSVPQLAKEDVRLQTWSRVEQAMCMGRLYGGSILVMVTEDDVPISARGVNSRDWLRRPLDLRRVGRVEQLQVFDATECAPVAWDTDPRSPGFRLPLEWQVFADGFHAWVHASRVVYFPGARRPPGERRYGLATRMPDAPVLQVIWEEVRRLTETLQGGAILAAEIRESILKIGELAERATGDEADAFESRLRQISRSKALIGMTILGPDDQYENRSNPPTGFDQLSAGAWEALAAVTGIPQVILMGSTPGGLNTDGESSWEGFRQLVSSYQESHRHELERLYTVLYAAQDGPARGRVPDDWALTFASLDEPNEAKLAETRELVAKTDAIYLQAGVIAPVDVVKARFGPGGWDLDLVARNQDPEPEPETPTPENPYRIEDRAGWWTVVEIRTGREVNMYGNKAAAEARVRELLATPPREDGLRRPLLSGAQLRAVTSLAGQVARGELARALAVELLVKTLRCSAEDAEAMLEPADAPEPPVEPRTDAGGCCILIPAAGLPELRARVEGLLGQTLEAEHEPHVTVLYLGEGLTPDELAEVVAVVTEEAAASLVEPVRRAAVVAFPVPDGPTPVVVEFGDGWALRDLHERLLRRLAHLVRVRQHRRYRPHLTLGYAPGAVGVEAATALLALEVEDLAVPVTRLVVKAGPEVLTAVPVGG